MDFTNIAFSLVDPSRSVVLDIFCVDEQAASVNTRMEIVNRLKHLGFIMLFVFGTAELDKGLIYDKFIPPETNFTSIVIILFFPTC